MAKSKKPLSELEAFVLGLIWQFGPISPYDIRRHMQRSPSTQWSASAGAIYPLVRKLEKLGFIASKAERTDPRKRTVYRSTAKGKRALQMWLGPPLSPEAVTVTYDPLRTRVRFLGVLNSGEQMKWLTAAAKGLDEVEKKVKDWQQTYAQSGPFVLALTRNGELELETRRKWIGEVGKLLTAAAKRPT